MGAERARTRPSEIINGREVMMASPAIRHVNVAANIRQIFYDFLKGKPCKVMRGEVDVWLAEDERYIPDVVVVCDPSKIKEKRIEGAPDLVAEILSPSTQRYDKGHKRKIYGKYGVKEYWVVNHLDRSIDAYLLNGDVLEYSVTYVSFTPSDLEDLKEDELKNIETSFHTTVFPDLVVNLSDVFSEED